MTVYILTEDPWDSDVFMGVFSTIDKAKAYAEMREGPYVLSWTIDEYGTILGTREEGPPSYGINPHELDAGR